MAFRRSHLAVAALLLTLAAGLPVAAQTAAPPPAAPPINVPAAPTAAHLAAARDVIIYSGAVRSFEQLLPNVIEQVRGTFTRQRPELIKDIEASLKVIVPEFDPQREELLNTAARIYASRMSEQDLKEAAAFFKSPAGKNYVETQPRIFDVLFTEMQGWMERVSQQAVGRLRFEMKKLGHDI